MSCLIKYQQHQQLLYNFHNIRYTFQNIFHTQDDVFLLNVNFSKADCIKQIHSTKMSFGQESHSGLILHEAACTLFQTNLLNTTFPTVCDWSRLICHPMRRVSLIFSFFVSSFSSNHKRGRPNSSEGKSSNLLKWKTRTPNFFFSSVTFMHLLQPSMLSFFVFDIQVSTPVHLPNLFLNPNSFGLWPGQSAIFKEGVFKICSKGIKKWGKGRTWDTQEIQNFIYFFKSKHQFRINDATIWTKKIEMQSILISNWN